MPPTAAAEPRESEQPDPATPRAPRLLRGLLQRWLRQAAADALEPTIYRFILRYSLRDQIYVAAMTLASFPFLYLSLDLPKQIVNDAIGGKHFPHTILGLEIGQIPYLLLLCGAFLVLVVINGWFKYHLNVRKGRVGERMLRRLRYQLYQRTLLFPLRQFDRVAAGEIVAMLTAELEPVGGFIGDAFALPIAQGGTLLTILIFMFIQNPLLGAAAVALYPVQGYVIPKLQRRIRALGRERVRKIRSLSDRVGETIAAQVDIRANAGAHRQLADISHRLGEIYDLRFEIYNRKFFVKFLNNFLGQLTPFFFYAIGGYFVITGELSFGALVAVLAAYKDLSSPWKELLDFYQNQQDVAIKYEQVVEQFQVGDMLDPRLLLDDGEAVAPPEGEIRFVSVSLVDSDGVRWLDGIDFTSPPGEHIAVLGPGNSGKDRLPQLLARLYQPSSGLITVGDTDINSLPFPVSGRLVGYVGPTTHLLAATVRDNIVLGLLHPPKDQAADGRAEAIAEARDSGNSEHDIAADWIDYAQAGVEDAAGLDRRIVELLRVVDLERDIYFLGLNGRLDPQRDEHAAGRLIEARRLFDERRDALGLGPLVEPFDPGAYNSNATIAENLLFGAPVGPQFDGSGLAENDYVTEVLDDDELRRDLIGVGAKLAEIMVELFGGVSPDHGLLESYSLVSAEELRALERVVGRLQRVGIEGLAAPDKARLLALAFTLVAQRDRLGLLDDGLQRRIVEARHRFAENLPEELHGAVEFFDRERYNPAVRVEANILFGTIRAGEADARERVETAIGEIVDELGLHDTIVAIGLDYGVGTGGARLSPAQRQKVAIARAVLKRPQILALNEATAVLDPVSETNVLSALREEFTGRNLLVTLSRPNLAREFNRALVMEQGRLVQQGEFEALRREEGPLAPLLAAE
jgi:ABC-type multidrug transport system fused ATPase/permease subunit